MITAPGPPRFQRLTATMDAPATSASIRTSAQSGAPNSAASEGSSTPSASRPAQMATMRRRHGKGAKRPNSAASAPSAGKPTSADQGDTRVSTMAQSTARLACAPAISAMRRDTGGASAMLSLSWLRSSR
ncbi:hypothetical protein D3C80_1619310 [compost metagenome]